MDVVGKTPVSYLQEYCVSQKWVPEYDFINSGLKSDKPMFSCRLTCEEYITDGNGTSKKAAKQNAAFKMLKLLESIRTLDKVGNISRFLRLLQCSVQCPDFETTVPKEFVNSVGQLDEFCIEYQLSAPNYKVIIEEGPPHAKAFTLMCSINNVKAISTSNTKKHAKHLAAGKMISTLQKYTDCIYRSPDVDEREFLFVSREFAPRKPYLSFTPADFQTCLSWVKDISPTLEQYRDNLYALQDAEEPIASIFGTIMSDLKINYRIKHINEVDNVHFIAVSVEVHPELTLIATDADREKAVNNCLLDVIKIICKFSAKSLFDHDNINPENEKKQPSPKVTKWSRTLREL